MAGTGKTLAWRCMAVHGLAGPAALAALAALTHSCNDELALRPLILGFGGLCGLYGLYGLRSFFDDYRCAAYLQTICNLYSVICTDNLYILQEEYGVHPYR